MDKDSLKRLLAGLSIAGLLSGAGLVAPPAAFGASSWTGDKKPPGQSGETEDKAGTVGTEKPAGESSWTGSKEGTGSADEEKKDTDKKESKGGKSSWT